jgi:hypothetical protein
MKLNHLSIIKKIAKRALSAPPTEVGKVVLQRMELKSPLTVRQGSVVPFEQQNGSNAIMYPDQQQSQAQPAIMAAPQPVIVTSTNRNQFIDNPYNNRGILKSAPAYPSNGLPPNPSSYQMIQQPSSK